MSEVNRRIVLAERPRGRPGPHNFRLETAPVPEAGAGEVLCRTIYLSLDPYMRGRMSDAPSYTPPVAIGEVMTGGTVGQVVKSKLDGFMPGDFVTGYGGWQDFSVFKAGEIRKVDPALAPISTALGVLGMPGMTAYTGLHEIGRPQAGETLVVAAASGAVGAVVGQIAKIGGCRVVGVAGSKAKCDYVVNELGFDACLDHRAGDFAAVLADACPKGGFIVWDFNALEEQFRREVGQWVRDGRLRYREDLRDGLEHAPQALIGLLEGENFGKLLVRVAPDPTA
jgi:NADPH-dependent curcumin reductase CurA